MFVSKPIILKDFLKRRNVVVNEATSAVFGGSGVAAVAPLTYNASAVSTMVTNQYLVLRSRDVNVDPSSTVTGLAETSDAPGSVSGAAKTSYTTVIPVFLASTAAGSLVGAQLRLLLRV